MKSRLKKFVKRYFRDPARNKKGFFIYYGHHLYFPKDSLIFKRAMDEGGIYEKDNLTVIQSYLNSGSVMFDIGANIGIMAVPLLWNMPELKVISVEASPNSLPYLNRTHAESPSKHRWVIVGKAVADKIGTLDFYLSEHANAALDGLKNTQRAKVVDTIKVECTTIDTIWIEQQRPKIDLIKIDIEGADLLALNGGIDCINTCRPVILTEWNQTNIKPYGFTNYDLMKFVGDLNYEIYYLPEARRITSLVEFNILCKQRFIENFLLIPAEKRD